MILSFDRHQLHPPGGKWRQPCTNCTPATCNFSLRIQVNWATKKKTGSRILEPWNTGCLRTGSLFHGLWNNPHITGFSTWVLVRRAALLTSSIYNPRHIPDQQPGALFFIAQVNSRFTSLWKQWTLDVLRTIYILYRFFSWTMVRRYVCADYINAMLAYYVSNVI